MAESVARVVDAAIEERFTDHDGRPWSQRRIAQALGIPPSVLSKLLARNGGITINALIALSDATATGIDELLGLSPPANVQ
jgi:plasmid maintenance system antidote protein VapI